MIFVSAEFRGKVVVCTFTYVIYVPLILNSKLSSELTFSSAGFGGKVEVCIFTYLIIFYSF